VSSCIGGSGEEENLALAVGRSEGEDLSDECGVAEALSSGGVNDAAFDCGGFEGGGGLG